jgi:KUP system potassium uptake protein
VFSSTFTHGNPSYEDLVQVLSVIIWSLTLMVTVKYVLIVLHADNEGEGGTFSCYSLLTRFVRLVITTRPLNSGLPPVGKPDRP